MAKIFDSHAGRRLDDERVSFIRKHVYKPKYQKETATATKEKAKAI
jgi:hypothetical protein